LPNATQAVIDVRKLEDYCLNPSHPRGRHKARVLREALDLHRSDAAWLRETLLEAAALPRSLTNWGGRVGYLLAYRRRNWATK
jgi:hypothetical protein